MRKYIKYKELLADINSSFMLNPSELVETIKQQPFVDISLKEETNNVLLLDYEELTNEINELQSSEAITAEAILEIIKKQKPVLIEPVFCKDCVNFDKHGETPFYTYGCCLGTYGMDDEAKAVNGYNYCSDGERRNK